MEGFVGSVAGGGRYDKMISKFTGMETPACGFSIGFGAHCNHSYGQWIHCTGALTGKAFLFEKGVDCARLAAVIREAMEEREKGCRFLVAQMNKNKKFQKEQLEKEGIHGLRNFTRESLKN